MNLISTRAFRLTALGLWSFAAIASGGPAMRPDAPIACSSCEEWNAPHEPYRVFGNTWYVGVAGLSAILISSDDGLILLDGGLPQSAPIIDANIRKLGFHTENIRLIANSHAHYDHAGGIAALQRASNAVVAASADGARALRQGAPVAADPQHAFGHQKTQFPQVRHVRIVGDGEVLHVGDLAITAHLTPGHTPGGTTWTWRSCEADRCLDIVYADSLTPVSAPGFRFTGSGTQRGIVDQFRHSIAMVEKLPCDVLLSVHPGFADMEGKLVRRSAETGANPFVDRRACSSYAADATLRLNERIEEEKR